MEIIPTKEILKSLCNDVEAASRQAILPTLTKVRFDACPTGFNDLDRLIGGISPGYIVIAGRPCHGAGELFRNTLINAILNFNLINNFSHKQKALIFSTSLSSQDFMSRVLCAFGLVSLNNLLKAQMNDNESAQFSKVVSFFAEQQDPFLIVDNMTPLFGLCFLNRFSEQNPS
ncbi:MAG: replicative helicase [Shewanella sp.]|jgi:replicative DNA helicase|nr:replicative helicase [Shewanella sp.]